MLPILRILPVGGVLLAIMLLVLALNPPDGTHGLLTPGALRMRGAMIAASEHPEWRQFIMQAAIRRADELNRLRALPDTRSDAPPEIAGLPDKRSDSDPEADDETGSIGQPPAATLPIDIGEPSTFELPVTTPEEQPPVVTPQRIKSRNESGIKRVPGVRRAKVSAKPKEPAQFDIFRPMFEAPKTKRPHTAGASTSPR
jgi:hypothetical protein